MTVVFAGDIGGTKTILRLVRVETVVPNAPIALETLHETTYSSQDYPDFTPMAQQFLASACSALGMPTIAGGCLGIAGPVVANRVELTNLSWMIDGHQLAHDLHLPFMTLINDFAAVGYGIFGLPSSAFKTLQTGQIDRTKPIAVLGAGTGLGECFLMPTQTTMGTAGSNYAVGASEGGHVEYAPTTPLEFELADYIRTTAQVDRVSLERVVSGSGILTIYQFLCDCKFANDPVAGRYLDSTTPAAAVSQAAIAGDDPIAVQTMELFVDAYGRAAGDLALHLLPYGGLYIAGGVAAKNLPLLEAGDRFLKSFRQKGRVSSVLDAVPLHVVLDADVGAIGSAVCAVLSR
ncbi:MAG: glucokinase [Coleofasciculaceae cyanobacterium RL_1_1]|nr:glucokinase [Coleofasciculaceae cyanobacterium RL_1_1]